MARATDRVTRDAILIGYLNETEFDQSGREDARHLVLPYIRPSDAVLDVGCGVGRILRWVHPYCKEAVGLDISRSMLRKARTRMSKATNVRFEVIPPSLRLPVKTSTIDFAYLYHVSEHLSREDTYSMLLEIRRCLRRRGAALVEFALIDHRSNQREFKKWARLGDPDDVRGRFYTEQEVHTLLMMASLNPQLRLYIPGEFVVIVTPRSNRRQGFMPLVIPHDPARPRAT
jgi:SAM-dependent methyltransferase